MKKFLTAAVAVGVSISAHSAPVQAGSEPLLGDVIMVGFNFCPRGFAEANGQLLPINQNQSLYSLLGTQFGGDGRTSFALPDLRGRAPIGAGTGAGLPTYAIGQKGGVETTTMTTANMPAHNHPVIGDPDATLLATSSAPSTNMPGGNLLATFPASVDAYTTAQGTPQPMHNNTVDLTIRVKFSNTGGGQSQNNMQPFQVIRFCMATQGYFPSRN